jgi:hypothetical protein
MESDEHGRTILTVDGSSMGNLLAMQAFIGAVYTGRLQLCGMPPTLAFEVYQVQKASKTFCDAIFYEDPNICQDRLGTFLNIGNTRQKNAKCYCCSSRISISLTMSASSARARCDKSPFSAPFSNI